MPGSLSRKIDFALIISAKHCNPNGNPLNGNRPRTTYEGIGEISDVCLKHKIRMRLLDFGYNTLMALDRSIEGGIYSSTSSIFDRIKSAKLLNDSAVSFLKAACEKWIDVRAFGCVFSSKGIISSSASLSIRGPITIHPAYSIDAVDVIDTGITKCVSLDVSSGVKGSDTMEVKSAIDRGVYVTYGSINCQLAEVTGFSDSDANAVKDALLTLFENDESRARPAGSMVVEKLIWWEHRGKVGQYSTARLHRSLTVEPCTTSPYYSFAIAPLDGLEPTIYDGV